ncbi:SRPBCC family protein [Lactiplantibacillus pentosus]|uniref:SRPBCC family protein n=1 Tax=Lactiplantibacillus pentosus TaxID=1589 RepID=UPI001331100A|nr:SRPBCC family protein [Lactiplantibacillus pentosus]MBQ0835759.1 SRPBCC family protein [Lactiplantibacillus pentosus]MBU7465233.1 SRPBCC family protein [Lactiplantibacillus pentosus]MBU7491201.1 SRPBCC family protein [Lactiplantibacillus pentosus]MBU7493740.1 SRPBCC family protein [Lactiplantibacillus pentosus]MBU7519795.1 SRPBCC family protein [Lactiplantibacillus pentosus]
MTKTLFTNRVLAQASLVTVRRLLADPLNLSMWATAVTTVAPAMDGYTLERAGAGLNPSEHLRVTTHDNQVIYQGVGDQLAYQVTFTLTVDASEQTMVDEQVGLLKETPSWLPMPLIKPVMQRDFQRKLNQFAALAGAHRDDD